MKLDITDTFSLPKWLKSIKYTLATLNGIFLITGILFIIVGAVILAGYAEYKGLITRTFFAVPSFVIATGVIIVFTSILGFYGAVSQQFYFIAAYVILMIIILVFEIAMAIVANNITGNAAEKIQSTMSESLQHYSSRLEVSKMWDDLQRQFQCCGVVGRFDFISNQIPVSCCHIDYGVVGSFICDTTNAYSLGCAEALGELLAYRAYVIAICGLVVACIQVPLTLLAAWMGYRAKFHEVELES